MATSEPANSELIFLAIAPTRRGDRRVAGVVVPLTLAACALDIGGA